MICEQDLFGKAIINKGNVSKRCDIEHIGDTVMVLLDCGLVYQYETTDRVSMRLVWVEVYQGGFATYKEIAAKINVSATTLKTWVKRYREYGKGGLFDKTGRGAKRTIDDQKIKDILALRAERKSMNEIARICSCSNASVCNIINAHKVNSLKSPILDGFELENENSNQLEDNSSSELPEISNGDELIENITNISSVKEVEDTNIIDVTESLKPTNIIDEEKTVVETKSVENSSKNESVKESESIANKKVDELEKIILGEPISLKDDIEEIRALDRSADRYLATVGKLYDAQPLFSSKKHLGFAGIFMAFVILANDSYLKIGMSIFKNIGPAFYGLRTTLLTFISFALLRIKRPEHLLENNLKKMGGLFGLDRIAAVGTVRSKIKILSKSIETVKFMKQLGAERAKEYEGDANIVMVDGHTIGYFGERKVGSTWSSRNNKVLHAHTENWVNLPGNAPLFSFETPFNNGLVSSLECVLTQTKEALKIETLTAIFDRGGSSAIGFESLTSKGFGIITYQKGNYKNIDESKFTKKNIKLGVRTYDYLPYEEEIELEIYEEIDKGKYKKPGRKSTKRTIKMRDIRIICEDGHQISILANEHVKISSDDIADLMFQRIGSQENIFKYMRAEFDVDGLVSYEFEDVDENIEHPNPEWKKQEKKINQLKTQLKTLLSKISDKLLFEDSKIINKFINSISDKEALSLINKINNQNLRIKKKEAMKLFDDTEMPLDIKKIFALKIFNEIKKNAIQTTKELKEIFEEIIKIKKQSNKKILEKLKNTEDSEKTKDVNYLNKQIAKETNILSKIPIKENAQLAGFQKPKSEPKRLTNVIKIAAYAIETKLFDILGKHYKYSANEGRKLIASAMRSTGSLELKPGEIVITLDQQANPRRTEAINAVLRELNEQKAKFPGSARIIRFQETIHEK